MSWGTDLVITVPVNPELVFIAARRVASIPGEQPFDVSVDHYGDTMIWSEPHDAFGGAMLLYHHEGLPITGYDGDPVMFVRIHVETSYGHPDGPGLHERFTTELGAWCDSQGLGWWTRDEADAHGGRWRERVAAFAD